MCSRPQLASWRRLTIPCRIATRANGMPLDPAIRVLSRSKKAAARCKPSSGLVLSRPTWSRTTSALPAPASLRPRQTLFSRVERSNFYDDRVALAAAAANRRDAEPAAATAQLMDEGADDPGAGGGCSCQIGEVVCDGPVGEYAFQ